MSRYKIINLILFIALILLVKYQQWLEPWRYGQWDKVPMYHSGWISGSLLTLASIVVCVLWVRLYTQQKIRLVEVIFPALIAIGSAWITYQLYQKWQHISIIK